jgi:hypothetical protein
MLATSYLHTLEKRVRELEQQLAGAAGDHETFNPDAARALPTCGVYGDYLPSTPDVQSSSQGTTRFSVSERPSQSLVSHSVDGHPTAIVRNAIELHTTRRTAAGTHRTEPADSIADIIDDLDSALLTLPKREAAAKLTKVYFQFANSSQPVLFEPKFHSYLDSLYSFPLTIDFGRTHNTKDIRLICFTVLQVFAVALLVLQKQDPSKMSTSLSDRYHRVALMALDLTGLPPGIEGVQFLLLESQYCYHHSETLTVWSTVGAALRLAVEIGLHKDPTEDVSATDLDVRRRVFWTAYAMDRNISIARNLPTCLADGAISVEVSNTLESSYQANTPSFRPC